MASTIPSEERRRARLEERISAYHGVGLDEVLDALAYLRDEGDSVIAGGSLAYGMGNHLSDLDIVIGGATTRDSSRVPLEHFVSTLRVDVWKLERRLLEEVFDRAEAMLRANESLHGSFGDVDHETDLKLLHRLAFGITLDGPPLTPPPGRDYRAIARDLVVREYLERLRTASALAQLTLAAGDGVAAATAAREAVEDVLNAAIAARGFPFSGDKWLRERLDREVPDLGAAYAPFARLPDPPTGAPPREYVARALELAQGLSGLDLAVEQLAAQASWQLAALQLHTVGDERLLVSPVHGCLWQLDAAEADAWSGIAAAGSQEDAGGSSIAMTDCSASQTALCLALCQRGLANLRWTEAAPIATLLARAGER